ncbi:GumC family protein [Candidatus Venteria ishoeyi]|uniref:Cryptic autophosphorylating protein tyrosine kinase Etk n=1 Tax=Candidatus Venteria ishoeyi TaxID=1899563 RepID=A0A1H6FF87_9GAMM|nr:GNVR domain-containing protein [Candidatus Venteria ishoeyi]MDM8546150.1 GNVR domain-containing protein [Candidatus Venteria ishoeyi]SEH08019.1 cryptic autophosphorylating protein tyrosine kinase Etk [Candidatus Venteria ishoeyi]
MSSIPCSEDNSRIIETDHAYSVRDALNVLFCHKWKISLFFLTVVSMITIITYRMPYVYMSEARLQIGVERDPTDIAEILAPEQNLNQGQVERVNNGMAVFKSRLVAGRAVDVIGALQFFRKPGHKPLLLKPEEIKPVSWEMREGAIDILLSGLSLSSKPRSYIVEIELSMKDPELAQSTLDTLIKAYTKRHLELSKAQASDVFANNLKLASGRLELTEEALHQFRLKYQVADMEQQKKMLIIRNSGLLERITLAQADVAAHRDKIKSLENSLKQYKPTMLLEKITGRANNTLEVMKSTLLQLKTQEVETTSRYPDSSRRVNEIQEQINRVEAAMAVEPGGRIEKRTGINQIHQNLNLDLESEKAEYQAANAKLKDLRASMMSIQQRLTGLVAQEMTLKRLKRDRKFASKEFHEQKEIMQRSENYAALDRSGITSVRVIEPATLSYESVSPNKKRNIVLGIILGLIGGIGIVFVIDYFDDSMKTSEDVNRRLKLPVLAMISSNEFEKCI